MIWSKCENVHLLVCGTTGKRKACKDCSCGLADELAAENKQKAATENAKSSCGSVSGSIFLSNILFLIWLWEIKTHFNFMFSSVIWVMHSDVQRVHTWECQLSSLERKFSWLAVLQKMIYEVKICFPREFQLKKHSILYIFHSTNKWMIEWPQIT